MRLDPDPRLPAATATGGAQALTTRLYELLRSITRALNEVTDGYVGGVAVVSTSYTVQAGDTAVLMSAAGGARTVTLQAPGQHKGKRVCVRKTEGGGNNVTVTPPSGTIDGAGALVLTAAAPRCDVVSDGTNFFTV